MRSMGNKKLHQEMLGTWIMSNRRRVRVYLSAKRVCSEKSKGSCMHYSRTSMKITLMTPRILTSLKTSKPTFLININSKRLQTLSKQLKEILDGAKKSKRLFSVPRRVQLDKKSIIHTTTSTITLISPDRKRGRHSKKSFANMNQVIYIPKMCPSIKILLIPSIRFLSSIIIGLTTNSKEIII